MSDNRDLTSEKLSREDKLVGQSRFIGIIVLYLCVNNTLRIMRNIVTLSSVLFLALMSHVATAQTQPTVVFSSPMLDSLLVINQKINSNQASIDGYRIQIYSGSGSQSKKEALEKRNKMLELFPAINNVYVVYNAPFWRVRVGNYRDRSEAMVLLNKIKVHFPGSYTVRDNTIKKSSIE